MALDQMKRMDSLTREIDLSVISAASAVILFLENE